MLCVYRDIHTYMNSYIHMSKICSYYSHIVICDDPQYNLTSIVYNYVCVCNHYSFLNNMLNYIRPEPNVPA